MDRWMRSVSERLQTFSKMSYLEYTTVAKRLQVVSHEQLNTGLVCETIYILPSSSRVSNVTNKRFKLYFARLVA